MTTPELRTAVEDLIAAIDNIVAAWERGDLAEADHYRTDPQARSVVSSRD